MAKINPIWALTEAKVKQFWEQDAPSGFSPLSMDMKAQSFELSIQLQRDIWGCLNCNSKKTTPVSLLPNTFLFCPDCGEQRVKKNLQAEKWMPPNGLASSDKSAKVVFPTAQTKAIDKPRIGAFLYAIGSGGLKQNALVAFDMQGGISVYAQHKWVDLRPKNSIMPSFAIQAEHLSVPEHNDSWFLSGKTGPVRLSIEPNTARYEIEHCDFPSAQCLASPAILDKTVYFPVLLNGCLQLCAHDESQPTKWALHNTAFNLPALNPAQKTIFGLPIIDLVRNQVTWVSENFYLILQIDGGVKSFVHLFAEGGKAMLHMGSPFQDSAGKWHQQCFSEKLGSFGWAELTNAAMATRAWHSTGSPTVSIGHFTCLNESYTRKQPWLETGYDNTNQGLGRKFPLFQIQQKNNLGACLYLDVPTEAALDEFYSDKAKVYACDLCITGSGKALCTIAISAPWLTQVWFEQDAMCVAHPELPEIMYFGDEKVA